MNNLPPTSLIAFVGAICAAVISAVVAYLSLIISKEQKISEFRQHWIDAVREDLADLLGLATNITVAAFPLQEQANSGGAFSPRELSEALKPYIGDAYAKYHGIVLRLNPEEHKALLALVERLEQSLSKANLLLVS